MNKNINRLSVGVFVFGAISILFGFAFFTGSLSFLRESNERFVLVFSENLYGLHEGSKVTFNGVRVGRVERFFLGEELEKSPIPVQIEIDRKLVRKFMVETDNEVFEPNGNIKKSVLPKLVGQLSQESFVTGILYINLITDVSESADDEISLLHGYPIIKTKGSILAEISESINLEKLSKQVNELIVIATKRLEDLDTKTITQEISATSTILRETLSAFRENYAPLGNTVNETVGAAKQMIINFDQFTLALNKILRPDSEFRFEVDDTLREVSGMAKSLKKLADMIERNPQSFIIGKPEAE